MSLGSSPSLPRKQRKDEHSAAYAARLSLTMQTECQDTRRALTKGREAKTPGGGALPPAFILSDRSRSSAKGNVSWAEGPRV